MIIFRHWKTCGIAFMLALPGPSVACESGEDESRLVLEAVVEASIADVWNAVTTKEGLESWNVAHAEVELKVGGKMLTHYDRDGKIGDPNTIENTILSFDPKRMFSFRATNPPEKFPFKEALKSVWHVMYFDEVAPKRTRVTLVGLGYGDDDDSKKLREFLRAGNDYTMKKLQAKFAPKAAP